MKSPITVRKVWKAEFDSSVLYAEVLVDVGGLKLYLTIYIDNESEIRISGIDSSPPMDDCLACLAYLNAMSAITIQIIRDQYRNQ